MTVATDRDFGRPGRAGKLADLLRRFDRFRHRLGTQWRVIRALMIRDMMSRYGRENIGFLWLIVEPIFLIAGVIVLWSLMKGTVTHGVSVVAFTLTGYSMLTLWRHIVARGTHCLRLNVGLLFHQNVRIIDTVLAMILMETISTFISFLFCYLLLYLLGIVGVVYDPLLLITAWLLMSLFVGGLVMIIGGITEMSKPVERMIQPVMYFTLPLTGAFSMASWLPEKAREFVLLFPMVHAMEMFRAGFLGPTLKFYYDPLYLFLCGIVTLTIGLWTLKRAERNFHVG